MPSFWQRIMLPGSLIDHFATMKEENGLPIQIGWVKYTPPGAALLFPELSVYYFLCYYISNCALIAWHKLHCTIAITTLSAGKAFSTLFFGDPICLVILISPPPPIHCFNHPVVETLSQVRQSVYWLHLLLKCKITLLLEPPEMSLHFVAKI